MNKLHWDAEAAVFIYLCTKHDLRIMINFKYILRLNLSFVDSDNLLSETVKEL